MRAIPKHTHPQIEDTVRTLFEEQTVRFQGMRVQLNSMEARLEERIDGVERRIDGLDARLDKRPACQLKLGYSTSVKRIVGDLWMGRLTRTAELMVGETKQMLVTDVVELMGRNRHSHDRQPCRSTGTAVVTSGPTTEESTT